GVGGPLVLEQDEGAGLRPLQDGAIEGWNAVRSEQVDRDRRRALGGRRERLVESAGPVESGLEEALSWCLGGSFRRRSENRPAIAHPVVGVIEVDVHGAAFR